MLTSETYLEELIASPSETEKESIREAHIKVVNGDRPKLQQKSMSERRREGRPGAQ